MLSRIARFERPIEMEARAACSPTTNSTPSPIQGCVLESPAAAALADGTATDAERRELAIVAQLLGALLIALVGYLLDDDASGKAMASWTTTPTAVAPKLRSTRKPPSAADHARRSRATS